MLNTPGIVQSWVTTLSLQLTAILKSDDTTENDLILNNTSWMAMISPRLMAPNSVKQKAEPSGLIRLRSRRMPFINFGLTQPMMMFIGFYIITPF